MAAVRLRLHPRTVMDRARRGELPGVKVGNDWRFSGAAIAAVVAGRDWQTVEYDEADAVLTAAEVAELLGFGQDKVHRLARAGVLPCTPTGRSRRFSRTAILQLLHPAPPLPNDV